jgi:hypothetical protein
MVLRASWSGRHPVKVNERGFESRQDRCGRIAQWQSACTTSKRPPGRNGVRLPGSHGETEIMTDYEFVVGGSSPPGSAAGPVSSAVERLVHTEEVRRSARRSGTVVAIAQQVERRVVVAEVASSNLASHPMRRWQSGRLRLAVDQESLGATVVQIHPGAPSFHGPVDRTSASEAEDRRFEPCWKRSHRQDAYTSKAACPSG